MANHWVVLDGVDKIKSNSNPQVELVVDDTVNDINDLQTNKLDATANAVSASKWQTARTLSLSGDATGSVAIDGSANASLTVAVANDSHTHDGRYYTETEINNKLTTLETDIKNDILGGAGAAYDTLKELQTELQNNDSEIAALVSTVGGKLGKTEKAADSDKLDGMQPSTAATGSTIVQREADGDMVGRYVYGSYMNMSHGATTRNTDTVFYSSTDAFIRKNSKDGFRASLDVYSKGESTNNFLGKTAKAADSDKLDGLNSTDFLRSNAKAVDSNKLDGLDSTQFLRSDASDVVTAGSLTIGTGGASSSRLVIKASDDNVSDHIQFYNGSTRVGEIGCEDGWLRLNQETAYNIYTPRMLQADGGFRVDGKTVVSADGNNLYENSVALSSKYAPKPTSNTGTGKALGWNGSAFTVVDGGTAGLTRTESASYIDFSFS